MQGIAALAGIIRRSFGFRDTNEIPIMHAAMLTGHTRRADPHRETAAMPERTRRTISLGLGTE